MLIVLVAWLNENSEVVVAAANVVLVIVTSVYVGLTGRICRAARAQAQAAIAQASTARRQAEVAFGTLLHMQRPVILFRVLDEERDGMIMLQLQNVGEGAAVWPKVIAGTDSGPNLLDPAPHLIAPRQFDEKVHTRQQFTLDVSEGDDLVLTVTCEDPRTGQMPPVRWRVYTSGDRRWYANLMAGDEA